MRIATICEALYLIMVLGSCVAGVMAALKGEGWGQDDSVIAVVIVVALIVCHSIKKANDDELYRSTLDKKYSESVERMRDPVYAAVIHSLEEQKRKK